MLGGLLLSNQSWDRIGDTLSEGDFYRADHRVIWRTIVKLIEDNKPADVLTVAEALKQNGELDSVGGLAYLQSLASATPSAANIRRYAEIVRERAIMRKLAEVGTDIAESAYTPKGKEAKQLLDEAETRILEIGESGGRTQQGLRKMSTLLGEVMERIDELYKNPASVTGVATGFVDLDEYTSGLHPGELIIVAGRPAMGKTSLALNIAEHVGLELKLPVLVFSMEMGGAQLGLRMLGSVGRVDAQRLRTGRLDTGDWDRLGGALGKLNEAPILIDETAALNPLELRSRARRLWREYGGLGLIVIDYLQLMSAAASGVENRATEISEISRSLKAMSKELAVPVIALSQLNRGLEQRPNKRPVMSDLRECVTGDTLVCLRDGRRVPVRELVGTDAGSLGRGRRRQGHRRAVRRGLARGPQAGASSVQLASGRSIRATAEHLLMAGHGWTRARRAARRATGSRWRGGFRSRSRASMARRARSFCSGTSSATAAISSTSRCATRRRARRTARPCARLHEALGSTVTRHAGRGAWHQLVICGNGNRWHPAGVGQVAQGSRHHRPAFPREAPAGRRVPAFRRAQIGLLLRHLWATDGCISRAQAGREGRPPRVLRHVQRGAGTGRDGAAASARHRGAHSRVVHQRQYRPDVHGGRLRRRAAARVPRSGRRVRAARRAR